MHFSKKGYSPRGQHFQRSYGRPCWSTQWTNQCRGRSTLNCQSSKKCNFPCGGSGERDEKIIIEYFSLRAQIFKLFLASCVPYVNFHCLQEKVWFIFVEVSPENWDTILTDSVTNMEHLARKQYLITHSFFRVRKHHICWISVKYCRIVACWEGFLGETKSLYNPCKTVKIRILICVVVC